MNPSDTYLETRYDTKPRSRVGTQSFFGGDDYEDVLDLGYTAEDLGITTDIPASPFETDPTTGDLGTIPDPLTTLTVDDAYDFDYLQEIDMREEEFGASPDFSKWGTVVSEEPIATTGGTRATSSSGGSLGGFFDSIFSAINKGAQTAKSVQGVIAGSRGQSATVPGATVKTPGINPSVASGGGKYIPASREGIPGAGLGSSTRYTPNYPMALIVLVVGGLMVWLYLRKR